MSVQEGKGTSNGISYAFKLTPNKFFGSYECQVHRSLLEKSGSWVDTAPFQLENHSWSITVEHHRNGYLGVYLFTENQRRVALHFAFTLVNFEDDRKSKTHGYRNTLLSSADGEGWRDVAAVAAIKARDSGFLNGGYFKMRVDMRIVLQDNESQSLTVYDNAAVFTWRLRHIKEMSPLVALTETFNIADTEWRLEAYPNGCMSLCDELSVYLVNRNEEPLHVNLELRVVNYASITTDEVKEFAATIDGGMSHGWDSFLPSCALEDSSFGFLNKGWITLVAKITLQGSDLSDQGEDSETETESLPDCLSFHTVVSSVDEESMYFCGFGDQSGPVFLGLLSINQVYHFLNEWKRKLENGSLSVML